MKKFLNVKPFQETLNSGMRSSASLKICLNYYEDPEKGKIIKLEKDDFLTVWFDFTGKYIHPKELVTRQIIALYR